MQTPSDILQNDPIEEDCQIIEEVVDEMNTRQKRRWSCHNCQAKDQLLDGKNKVIQTLQAALNVKSAEILQLKSGPGINLENTKLKEQVKTLVEEIAIHKERIKEFEKQNRKRYLEQQLVKIQEELNRLQ